MKLLSRKFLFAVLLEVMAFVLVLVGKVEAAEFLAFSGVIGATYVAGNVSSKFAEKATE